MKEQFKSFSESIRLMRTQEYDTEIKYEDGCNKIQNKLIEEK